MGEGFARFVRHALTPEEVAEVRQVDHLAGLLKDYLTGRAKEISRAHVHGAQSSAIQVVVSDLLRGSLGFTEEVLLTAEMGVVTQARPDFYFELSPGRGILAEVERGGTVNNNHDLKDFWKTHVAPDAQHLFLIVPNANWTKEGNPRERPFQRVSRRLAPFFGDARREVDVVSLHVFGYGPEAHAADVGEATWIEG